MRLNGYADHGFELVAEQFSAQFDSGHELGAAVAVYARGVKVVDLWAGIADRATGREWTEDTLGLVFSVSKGLTAITAHVLAERGQLDLDAPIATYWPEFGHRGKTTITTRMALSHRAGLPLVDAALTTADVISWTPVIHALEHQQPMWQPGSEFAYHALTYGYLVGEVIRRVTGTTVGDYFRSTIAEPLGLDCWIGLPPEKIPQLSMLEAARPEWSPPGVLEEFRRLLEADDSVLRALTLNGALRIPVPGLSEKSDWNTPSVITAEIPAANACTTARSLAKLYAACIAPVDHHRVLSEETVRSAVIEQSAGTPALGLPSPARWGSGFMLQSGDFRPMLSPGSFGHDGAGGQLGFADPEHKIGFGYICNQMGGVPDNRANELCASLLRCLDH